MQPQEFDVSQSRTQCARNLITKQKDIWEEWEQAVRAQIGAATNLEHPILLNTLPDFLTKLAEALAEEHPRMLATENTNIPQAHGNIRAYATDFRPEQLIQEYQILRSVICEALGREGTLDEQSLRTIHTSIDQSIRDSVAAYSLVQTNIREQFIAGLTHDLRQPLNVIKMSAQLIDGAKEGEVAMLANQIVVAVDRAEKMVRDLLDTVAEKFGESLRIHVEKFDVLALVQEVAKEWNERERKNLHITGKSIFGYWDREALHRALSNLISNAFKYGLPDRPVRIHVTGEEGRIEISVHNEGVSIPLNERELLFQPFRRAASAVNSGKKGWGIGLSLIRSVAQAHGGSVLIESPKEGGTTFTINILQDARQVNP